MYLYLRAKFQISSVILTSYRRSNFTPTHPHETRESPPRLGLICLFVSSDLNVWSTNICLSCSQYWLKCFELVQVRLIRIARLRILSFRDKRCSESSWRRFLVVSAFPQLFVKGFLVWTKTSLLETGAISEFATGLEPTTTI